MPAEYTPVRIGDCAPGLGPCVHTADSIAWGPHNVLAVLSQWNVALHIHSLASPIGVIHPTAAEGALKNQTSAALTATGSRENATRANDAVDVDGSCANDSTHGDDGTLSGAKATVQASGQQEVIIGGKWAKGIAPEDHHPVAARIGVHMSSERLLVYRVCRMGTENVSWGAGVVIRWRHTEAAGAPRKVPLMRTATDREAASSPAIARTAKRQRVARSSGNDQPVAKSSDCDSGEEDKDDNGDELMSSSCNRPRGQGGFQRGKMAETPREGRGGSGSAGRGRGRGNSKSIKTATLPSPQNPVELVGDSCKGVRLLMFEWTRNDALIVASAVGIHVIGLYGVEDEPRGGASQRCGTSKTQLSRSDVMHLSDSGVASATSTSRQPRVIEIQSCEHPFGDFGLPSAMTLVEGCSHRWLRAMSQAPGVELPATMLPGGHSSFTDIDAALTEELVALAFVGLIELLYVTPYNSSGGPRVVPLRRVFATGLAAVPSAAAAIMIAPGGEEGVEHECRIEVFIATPFAVSRGSLSLPPDAGAPGVCEVRQWRPIHAWGADDLHGDSVIRALRVLRLPAEGCCAVSAAAAALPPRALDEVAVLGIGFRQLVGFFSGKASVSLFRCAELHDAAFFPVNSMSGIAGIAIHPSLSIAVLQLQYGRRFFRITQLLAVGASCTNTFSPLLRLLDVASSQRNRSPSRDPVGVSAPPAAIPAEALWLTQSVPNAFFFEELLTHNSCAFLGSYREQMAALRAGKSSNSRTSRGPKVSPQLELLIVNLRESLRREYVRLKSDFGIELFARFSQSDAHWRLLLRRAIMLSRSDPAPWRELVMGTAAAKLLAWSDTLAHSPQIGGATSGFSPRGAFEYLRLYADWCAQQQQQQRSEAGFTTVDFTTQLEKLLTRIQLGLHRVYPQPTEVRDGSVVADKVLFACSVCDRPGSAPMSLSLVSNSTDDHHQSILPTEGVHTVMFCASSFEPISLYAADALVSRCALCGTYCRVTGALCLLCGGMIL